jgi:hypothetical protein
MKTKNVFTEITFSGDRRVFSINLVISPYFWRYLYISDLHILIFCRVVSLGVWIWT